MAEVMQRESGEAFPFCFFRLVIVNGCFILTHLKMIFFFFSGV